ncbi:MAG: DNA replication/repair protein RecF [Clostridia bacterium]|nr:DNA replication/repair protein RecF [Clostridia bacterium]
MHITSHYIKNYRNIEEAVIEPVNGVNVIYGENGHGKTNIIESIWLFTGCNSFRTRKNYELIQNNREFAKLETSFEAYGREKDAKLIISDNKEAYLNSIKQISPRKFLGEFQAVVFSPSVLSIIQDGPSEKRKFIDIAISLIKPNYASLLSKYNKAVFQRNSLLKQINNTSKGEELLFAFDEQLALLGGKILNYRLEYIDKLKEEAPIIYGGISNGREKMEIKYINSLKETGNSAVEWSNIFYNELSKNHKRDIFRLATTVGPHKDDIDIILDSMNVRSYGSQGQQRTCALSLKLAEAAVIKDISGEQPIALLDDVMSELDEKRQKYLIKYFDGWQVFVTCCDRAHLKKIKCGRAYRVKDGKALLRY